MCAHVLHQHLHAGCTETFSKSRFLVSLMLLQREVQGQGHFRVCSVFSGILSSKLASDSLSDKIKK